MDEQAQPDGPPVDLGKEARNALHARLLKAGAFQIAEAYAGAVRLLGTPDMPARRHMLAHLVRDIAEGLPDVVAGTSKELRRSNTTPLLDKLAPEWRQDVPSTFTLAPTDSALSLTTPVPTKLVKQVEGLITEHERGKLNRRDKYARLMEALRPGSLALRPVLEPVIREWVDLVRWFQEQTHVRREPAATVGNDPEAELQRRFENFEYCLRGLLDGHFEVVKEIDEILDAPGSIEDKLRRVQPLLAGAEQLRHFFERLDDPAWLKPLEQAGFFAPPPPVVDAERNTTAYAPWPAAPYLVRMAAVPKAQEAITHLAERIKTANVRAHEDLAEMALRLPTPLAARLASALAGMLKSSSISYLLPQKLFSLTESLATTGETTVAQDLLKALVKVVPDPRAKVGPFSPTPRTAVDHHRLADLFDQHLPAIVTALGLDALDILASALAKAMKLSGRGDPHEDAEDHSSIWYPALEQAHDSDARGVLVGAVRRAAEHLASSNADLVPAVLDRLERRRWMVFRRLALHVLLRLPNPPADVVRARLLDQLLFDQFTTCREYRLLVERGFTLLSEEQQQRWLAMIGPSLTADGARQYLERWSGKEPSEQEIAKELREWQWRHIGPVAAQLPSDRKAHLDVLRKEFGDPPPAGQTEETGRSQMGFDSPLSTEEVRASTPAELAAFCKDYRRPDTRPLECPEGLRHNIEIVVAEAPQSYAEAARAFKDLHPTYVRGVMGGLWKAVNEKRAFPWASVLDLAQWAVARPIEEPEPPRRWEDPGWGSTRGTLTRLLGEAIGQRPSPLRAELKDSVWALLERLCSDPNESRRAEALAVGVRFAFWAREASGQPPYGAGTLDDLPDLRRVLDAALDSAWSPTIHQAIGHQLPWLVFLDEAWLRARLPQIFPPAPHEQLWEEAWRGYLCSGQLNERMFAVLLDVYRQAVDSLGPSAGHERERERVEEALANHLAAFWGAGTLETNDAADLVSRFFDRASVGLRRCLLFSVPERLRRATDPPAADVARFRRLWEERRAVRVPDELRAFGLWFGCRLFDEAWRLAQLEFVLREIETIDHDHVVVETLADVTARHPVEAVRCFALLVRNLKDAGPVYGWLDPAKAILAAGLRSADRAVRDDALEAFHKLGSLGFRAREILPLSDDLDDPAAIPYFTWDHPMTVAEIRKRLTAGSEGERHRMLGQILREARDGDVWKFTTPQEVLAAWPHVEKHLGRRKGLWELLFSQWKEQGLLAG